MKHPAYHVVSAWVEENHITLDELAVNKKSNEITAIPELLDLVDVAGDIVTIDAMGCQTDIAAKIREKGADYVLALKDNQPTLALWASNSCCRLKVFGSHTKRRGNANSHLAARLQCLMKQRFCAN